MTDEQLRERENRLLLSLVARKRTLMTDEQLREQFEEVRGKGYPDHVNEHLFQRDEFDNYVLSDMNSQWHGWRMAYRSRDAEVQALREQVDHAKRIFQYAEVRSGYCVCGEALARHSHLADCSYTDRGQWESELWLKRAAALLGEEETNHE